MPTFLYADLSKGDDINNPKVVDLDFLCKAFGRPVVLT